MFLKKPNLIYKNVKYLKTFEYYQYIELIDTTTNSDLQNELLDWIQYKLGVKILKRLGSGVNHIEGEIYDIGNRVLKLSNGKTDINTYLVNKNIEGVCRYYAAGILRIPKKFKGDIKGYTYHGVSLLNPNKTNGDKDFDISYVIMEKGFGDEKLSKEIKFLGSDVWWKYIMRNANDFNGMVTKYDYITKNTDKIHDSEEIRDFILKGIRGFGDNLFSVFSKYDVPVGLEDDVLNFVKTNYKKQQYNIVARLLLIFNNLKSNNIYWLDCNAGNFVYNKKHEIIAIDIDSIHNSFTGKTQPSGKLKNIIREDNWYDTEFGKETYKKYTKPDMNLFLIDFDYTFNWIKEHNPYMQTCFGDHCDTSVEELTIDNIVENEINIKSHIKRYMSLYQKWKSDGFIDVYRTLNINSISNIDFDKLGVYWSFIDENDKWGRSRDFINSAHPLSINLYTRIPLEYVNWENSLDNFCYFGGDEDEVKLKPKSKLIITKYIVFRKKDGGNTRWYYDGTSKTYDNVNIKGKT